MCSYRCVFFLSHSLSPLEGGLNVLVKSITLLSEGREIVTKDLTGEAKGKD